MVVILEVRMGLKVGYIRGFYRDLERDRFELIFVDVEYVVIFDGRDVGICEIYLRF